LKRCLLRQGYGGPGKRREPG